MKNGLLILFALVLTACVTTHKPLRIVAIGDSLTACGGAGGHYTDWLALWLPECEIINKGIGGDTLGRGRARFQRDVMDLHPDVVIIELGANDFWKAKRPLDELAFDLESMVKTARRAGAQVVVASCFGDVESGDPSPEFNGNVRARYARGIAAFEREICERYNCFYVPNMQIDIKPVKDNPLYWSDNNHPNKAGNEQVARRILTELKKAIAAFR